MPGRSGVEYQAEVVDYALWNDLIYTVPVGSSVRDEVEAQEVKGIHVHVYNPEDERDDHWFWIWSYARLDWDQWDDQIEISTDMHNMALA